MAIQSPRSSKVLKEALDEDHNLSTVSNVLSSVKTKRSKTVNTARRLLISQEVKDKSLNSYEARKLNTSTSLAKNLQNLSVEETLTHGKLIQPNQRIKEFYNRDDISRVVPHKNATILIKNDDGVQERVCLRILEKTLEKVFEMFCKDNPNEKIKQQTFEQLQPKNVRLRRTAKQMVWCCTIHTNINYLRQAAIRYCNISNNSQTIINALGTNENLCNYYTCPIATTACIQRVCDICCNKTLLAEPIICSKEYAEKGIDCEAQKHKIHFKQFEHIDYEHAGKIKKKLSLIDKIMSLILPT